MTRYTTLPDLDAAPRPRSRKWLWAKRIFLGWLLLNLVVAAANWRNIYTLVTFNPFLFGPDYPQPASPAEARDQDYDYLTTLTDIDRSFTPEEAAEFQRVLNAARADTAASREADFLSMAKAVALADNGHTNISYRPLSAKFPSVGVRFAVFADGVFVVSAPRDSDARVGDRLVAVDGRPVAEVEGALAAYRGGNAVWRRNILPAFLILPSVLHAAGLADSPQRVRYTLQDATGRADEVALQGGPAADFADTADWEQASRPDESTLPPTLREWGQLRSVTLPDNGHYLRMPPGFRADGGSIKSYLKAVQAGLPPQSLDYFVADFRGNSGGNYGLSRDFAKQIPDVLKPDGTLYLVTDKDTFSAAIVTLALMKFHSGGRAVIIGEPMGDREAFWAERGKAFTLPNSGWSVNYATGFHDWAGDCTREAYCFTRNIPHDVAAGSLAPTVRLPMSYEDLVAGTDPVYDYVRAQHGRG